MYNVINRYINEGVITMLKKIKDSFIKYSSTEEVAIAVMMITAMTPILITENIVFEDWDNEPTHLTESANENFQDSIKKITLIQKAQDIATDQQIMFEYKNLDNSYDLNSPQWLDYKTEEATLQQKTQALSERLSQEKQSFFNNAMLNTDITEQGWEDLVTTFKRKTSFDIFPDASIGYTLKECQLESSKQSLTSQTARAEFTNSCIEKEGTNDTRSFALAIIFGFASMIPIAAFHKKSKNKLQKRKMN